MDTEKREKKTYKRETATAMLAGVFGFFVWGVFEPAAAEFGKFLTPFVFVFAGAAFGVDAVVKQLR